MAEIYTALLIAAAITNLALLYLLIRRPVRSPVLVSFALFIVAITVWSVPQIIINWMGLHQDLYERVDRISALGYVTLPSVFFVFSLAFTKKLDYLKKIWVSAYVFIPSIVFLYLSWTTFLIDNHSQEAIVINQWGYNSRPGEYFSYFLFWLESLMVASIGILIVYYRSVKNYIQRKQVVLLIIAILVPLILGSITDGVLPLFEIYIFPAAVPLTTFMGIIIGYAILRYELFDIEAHTILSSISDGVISVNLKGRIGNSNNALGELIGRHPTEVVGKKVHTLISSKNSVDEDRFLRSIQSGRKFTSSSFMIKSKHKKIPVSVSVTPIELNHKVVGATVVVKDIREEKKREESKDEFISVASHELKTPITSIKLYADILTAKISPNTPEHTVAKKLQDQVNRMLVLTNDLLDLSRLRNGGITLNPEQLDLAKVIEEVVETFQKTKPQREIVLKNNLKREVFADKTRVMQVITNLVNNALKYSPSKSKVIVTSKIQDGKAMISVKDFGQGIPKEEQSKVFDRFYQVENNGNKQSLGIGLYVSASIIKEHKGKIWVESKENKGSTFFFTLPLSQPLTKRQAVGHQSV